MLNDIRGLLGPGDPEGRTHYAHLLEELRQGAPDVFRQSAGYYHEELVRDAIADDRWGAVPQLLAPFTEELRANIELFARVIDELAYHGQVQILIQVMTRAWSELAESDWILPGAVDEFGGKLMGFHLFHYLETTENPRADDPVLLKATAPYGEWKDGWLERFIPRLTTSEPSDWKIADFDAAVDADQWDDNLSDLLAEFVADRRRAGVPYSRGYMAWMQLGEALHRQFSATPEPFTLDLASPAGGKRRAKAKQIPAPLPLVPRYHVLDQVLVDLFPLLGEQPYQAAATAELLPAYLHFLARLGLIHPAQLDAALDELWELCQPVPRTLTDYGVDPRATQAVGSAWSGEVLAAIREDPALVEAREMPPAPLPQLEGPIADPGTVLKHTFKVTYLDAPKIWRTIEVSADQTLDDLHHAILEAVDFDPDHLYSFYISNRAWDQSSEYAHPHAQGPSAARVKIGDLNLRMKQRFLYLFDYGDEHRFEVQLIDVAPEAAGDGEYPRIVEVHGKNPEQYW
jgi:hypothetical protein